MEDRKEPKTGKESNPACNVAPESAPLVENHGTPKPPEHLFSASPADSDLSSRACLDVTLDDDLRTIFDLVKANTGHDFSSYKRNTVLRRIERRMAVNGAGELGKYIDFLRENPGEALALCREILIGVTGFFRDPEAFEVLRTLVVPRLFAERGSEDPVRIWLPCCATGEEAYSVAMLIREFLEYEGRDAKVQLFATDLDESAVARARSGLYSDDIGPDVGEERLRKFFTRSDGRWQVVKPLREMILFTHHSVIKDPPFSRLDLLVCRNFLIYLDSDMQKRLIALFHMVLKPGGFIFLGAAETVERNSDLFAPVDKKWKIYRRLQNGRSKETLFPFTSTMRKPPVTITPKRLADAAEPSPGAAAERLLAERYFPPCVVVNEKNEILHVSSGMRRYLEVPAGGPTRDLLKMVMEELRPTLRVAICKAFTEQREVVFRAVKLVDETAETAVNVLVEPFDTDPSCGRLALVVLEPAPLPASHPVLSGRGSRPGDESSGDTLVRQLEEQLRITDEQLRATMEQLETSNEGYMSANEELMSINEELQSTNEELETSKEELQAMNEELTTVNAELQEKVEELNQVNGDMENLFASSGIAAIFLDPLLVIKRFSPAMAAIFNLIPADIGRPFRHLAGTIDWAGLPEDAQTVLENLTPVEREVTALEDGRYFIMRVLPYRTIEGRVDGIVVTLIDITERKRMEEKTAHLASFPRINPNPVIEVDLSGRVIFGNPGTQNILETAGKTREDFFAFLPHDMDEILRNWDGRSDVTHFREVDIGKRTFAETVYLSSQFGVARIYGYEITKRKQAEDAVRRARDEWERTFDSVPDLIAILDDKHRIIRVNRAMALRLGLSPEECVGRICYKSVHGTDEPPPFCPHTLTLADGLEHVAEVHEEHLGGDFLVTTTPLLDTPEGMGRTVHVARDITDRKRTEQETLRHVEEVERFNRVSVGRELRMIELKKEINELCARLGETKRYSLEFEE